MRGWSQRYSVPYPQASELLNTNADYTVAYVSFGEAANGELYTVSLTNGTIHKLNFSVSGGGGTIPNTLIATGCVNPAQPTQPSSGLIPYAPVAPFWSDGALKDRWIGLPSGTQITVRADGDWDFPAGSVLVKSFRLNNQLIGARLLMRHPDGVWGGYTYEWNAAQTDATLVTGGKSKVIGTQTWIYRTRPSVSSATRRRRGTAWASRRRNRTVRSPTRRPGGPRTS